MIFLRTLLYMNVGLKSKLLKKGEESNSIPDIEIYFSLIKNIDKISLYSTSVIDF